ncbi:MAG: 3D domain-containing protein [Phycisphaerales bacterium]
MAIFQDAVKGVWDRCQRTQSGRLALAAGAAIVAAGSAIAAKELQSYARPLAMVDVQRANDPLAPNIERVAWAESEITIGDADDSVGEVTSATDGAAVDDAPTTNVEADQSLAAAMNDTSIRWFDGRPIRPARTMSMVVTAYSPDWRSCGDSDDGLTATLHPVSTNGHRLVAADTRLLPFGSMLTIPGYDNGQVVPVLDVGGAIKGHRLDLLFPTHEEARQWGRKRMTVTVWEYADGKPAPSARKSR